VPALQLDHLDRPGVRDRMITNWTHEIDELERRLPRAKWPFGSDLNASGWERFLVSMPTALAERDMTWLADQMNDPKLWHSTRLQISKKGRPYAVRLNIPTLAAVLAHGEFNIAYTRAVAELALDEGVPICEVYRAGHAVVPRWSCTCIEGPGVSCAAVLEGQRAYFSGRFAEVTIPAGPNCHHSIRIDAWLRGLTTVSSAERHGDGGS
jgi:hypothetical protein